MESSNVVDYKLIVRACDDKINVYKERENVTGEEVVDLLLELRHLADTLSMDPFA